MNAPFCLLFVIYWTIYCFLPFDVYFYNLLHCINTDVILFIYKIICIQVLLKLPNFSQNKVFKAKM